MQRNATVLLEEAQIKIKLVPSSCGNITSYFTRVMAPCLPAAVANGTGKGLGDMAACCDAVNSNHGVQSEFVPSLIAESGHLDCMCSSHEVAQYLVDQKLLTAVTGLADVRLE